MAARNSSPVPATHNPLPPDPYSGDPYSALFVLFRPVPGYPGYGVDTDGNVWSCRVPSGSGIGGTWRRMRPAPRAGQTPYLVCVLSTGGRKRTMYVHRLVLETFLGPPGPAWEGCHFPDPDPGNNRLANLRWGSRGDNSEHRKIHGTTTLGRKGAVALTPARVAEVRALLANGVSGNEVARRLNICRPTVSRIANRRSYVRI
jgi:hypothetical protein